MMRNTVLFLGALAVVACGKEQEAKTPTLRVAAAQPALAVAQPLPAHEGIARRKLFMDVHDVGPGKITLEAAAGAHRRDLATQGKYDADFKAYWVDEKNGKIYCLIEAPSAEATTAVHKEAHGLLANQIMQVSADSTSWTPTPGAKLFLDVHHLGAGKVTAEAVAEAHKKDLAVQDHHGAKFLNYWFDAASGTVLCLVEAPSAEAAIAVHKEAHGLIPESISEVSQSR